MRKAESAVARELQDAMRRVVISSRRAAVEYSGIGNCATLAAAPLSSAVILPTPCFLTSSIRRTECIGRKVRLTPGELALDSLLRGVQDHRGALAEHQLLDLDETEQRPRGSRLPGVDLVNLALIHEHDAENVTGCHGSS